MRSPAMPVRPPYQYEELADFITAAIESGTLRPGSRAPSLRGLCKEQGMSLWTALRGYRLLEDRGVLEARPRSGFYVARGPTALLHSPWVSKPSSEPVSVSISGMLLKLLEFAADPGLVPLGCAIPSTDLLGSGRLDRFLSRTARMKGIAYNIYTEPKGDLRLRQEIARRALSWGQALSPEDIVVTCGCTEAL